MPKSTFTNLPPERQQQIRELLLTIFYEKPVSQVKVSEIVAALKMSRGIFYKYFEDLNDAYDYVIHYYAGKVHGEIIEYVTHHEGDFFKGMEEFLLLAAKLKKDDLRYREIVLLTQNSYLFSYRSEVSHGMEMWQEILAKNHFNIQSEEESISFLYFSMKLVIDSLTDMLANHWSEAELIADFRFKSRWLTAGLRTDR
ncbi:TetR family transcriptional regulator [Enterococcus sp. 669A]|uniref:TetR family transcriptional regulator n=1 Tax=Candidatus Enterococcus moelleringii TaxID=2815325 RepID=A0ABS3LD96_9ENTE|nr:TetR/AcrR family transcriptional regulator [Enterococcus sp. 669A]MBO1307603.1 TetR family transcriptional regulator [Enterococcus sp. 669A]